VLRLALAANLEGLAALDVLEMDTLALLAGHPENDLLGGLGFLAEHRFRLPAEALLLPVVATLPLGAQCVFCLLVLCDLVILVLLTFLAERPLLLWYVHLRGAI